MSELNVTSSSTISRGIVDYSVASQSLEYAENDEVYIDFLNATKYFGYYKKYGQLKKAIDTLSIYVVGKGYETNAPNRITLNHLSGWGKDTAVSILWNLQCTALIQGDSFAEIIKDPEDKSLLNLKPISPERMRIILDKKGLIVRYEKINTGKEPTKFKPEEIFHLCSDRIGDEQKGTSVIESCEWVINAIEEARRDYRVLLHRNIVPLRIIEIDTDDKTKRNAFMVEYKDAIQKGEVLIVPKGTVEVKDTTIQIQDPIAWIQSLENYFYLAVGIPKVIASPDALSEGTSKMGYLIFEPIYTYRQTLLEAALWNQLGIKLTFNRPPSLIDNVQTNEAKNTSQTSFQPKDTQVTMGNE